VLFTLSLFAEFIANDKPIFVSYRGDVYVPIFKFYPETRFGGDFKTEAAYKEIEVECLILSGGLVECLERPDDIVEAIKVGKFDNLDFSRGWIELKDGYIYITPITDKDWLIVSNKLSKKG
jgi:microcin C transport system permease protein